MQEASLRQGKHILELLLSLSHDEVQQLIQNTDLIKVLAAQKDLQEVDRDMFSQTLQFRHENPFWQEMIKDEPTGEYPKEYLPLGVSQQAKQLSRLYPGLDNSYIETLASKMIFMPEGSEMRLVWPKLSSMAAKRGIDNPYTDGYAKLVAIPLAMQEFRRNLPFEWLQLRDRLITTFSDNKLEKLWLRPSVCGFLVDLEKSTPGDYNVTPIQTGELWRGRSANNATWEMEKAGQWPLPSWVVLHHLILHPSRFGQLDFGIDIGVPGDLHSMNVEHPNEGWGDSFCIGFLNTLRRTGGGRLVTGKIERVLEFAFGKYHETNIGNASGFKF